MKISMLLIFCVFLIGTSRAKMPDPFEGIENLASKIDFGVQRIVQGAHDQLKPLANVMRKTGKKVFGGLNKRLFKLGRGAILGLEEVVGTPVKIDDLTFLLATSENADNPRVVNFLKPEDVADTTGKIFIIIHGWQSSSNASWFSHLTKALLGRYADAHVVQLDWHKPASDNYAFAAFNTESVGDLVGTFVIRLVNEYHVPKENIVLIGHSLGGQISGWAGKKFKSSTGQKLTKIVALDPAGPLFCLRPASRRLHKHDAEVVIVVHTDAGMLGFLESCGTIDFFPNGGSNQPGCAKVNIIDVQTILNPLSCSHLRAYEYFVEAINSTGSFSARKCASFTSFLFNLQCENVEINMGDLNGDVTGDFYLNTASSSPFSKATKFLKQIRGGERSELAGIDNGLTDSGDTVLEVNDGGVTRIKRHGENAFIDIRGSGRQRNHRLGVDEVINVRDNNRLGHRVAEDEVLNVEHGRRSHLLRGSEDEVYNLPDGRRRNHLGVDEVIDVQHRRQPHGSADHIYDVHDGNRRRYHLGEDEVIDVNNERRPDLIHGSQDHGHFIHDGNFRRNNYGLNEVIDVQNRNRGNRLQGDVTLDVRDGRTQNNNVFGVTSGDTIVDVNSGIRHRITGSDEIIMDTGDNNSQRNRVSSSGGSSADSVIDVRSGSAGESGTERKTISVDTTGDEEGVSSFGQSINGSSFSTRIVKIQTKVLEQPIGTEGVSGNISMQIAGE